MTCTINGKHKNVPASYLILFRGKETLLLRRFNTGYEDGKYSLVAGHVDPGETFTQCVIREAEEEAGIRLQPEDLRVVHVMHRDSHMPEDNERVDVFFLAERWEGEIENREPHRCDDLSWFDTDNLPENMIPYIRQVIRDVQAGVFYSEYGWRE